MSESDEPWEQAERAALAAIRRLQRMGFSGPAEILNDNGDVHAVGLARTWRNVSEAVLIYSPYEALAYRVGADDADAVLTDRTLTGALWQHGPDRPNVVVSELLGLPAERP